MQTNPDMTFQTSRSVNEQEASLDIWDKKYRLKSKDGTVLDQTMDDTYQRLARALSQVEKDRERAIWYEKFLWALRQGAIPAGRIVSNAGATEHKPATSTINCTVSGTIRDSMDDILGKVHEAGLTLKAGCGIGYEFSTLRPRGAYVSGAGAYTSGPLSFMDIYDRMCFTVSSAGGRRGAQMGTFDVEHPDVLEFIRAKREDGRLRQFNLSLLISRDFMEAVKQDGPWPLAFPIDSNEAQGVDLNDGRQIIWREWPETQGYVVDTTGRVACKVYKTVPARHVWDVIMRSTYEYAEPGFILIDRINEMNNNWWCENIRATNPCVTADTRLHTQYGLVRIGDLYASGLPLEVSVDRRALGQATHGIETRPAQAAFVTAVDAPVYRVTTEDGYEIKATEWHDFYTHRGKIKLRDLKPGDELLIQSGKGQFGSAGSREVGLLLGLIAGEASFSIGGEAWLAADFGRASHSQEQTAHLSASLSWRSLNMFRNRQSGREFPSVAPRQNWPPMRLISFMRTLRGYGLWIDSKRHVPEIIWRGSETCVKAYLRALFQTGGGIRISEDEAVLVIVLASHFESLLRDVQVLLSNFGVCSRIHRSNPVRPGHHHSGVEDQMGCELIIDAGSCEPFMHEIGFLAEDQNAKYREWAINHAQPGAGGGSTRIADIVYVGLETVFDTTQPDHNTVIFNGLVTGQCGEQPLPPYGSCLLGSVNLTKFVREPFTERARFDWDEYREVVRIFTRMLDNVVEVNGLPLAPQRTEIEQKRRHGMGFLGLGSTLTLLGHRYGSPESVAFTESVAREMALAGWREALTLAREKGPAPIMQQSVEITPRMLHLRPELVRDGYRAGQKIPARLLHARYSHYMRQLAEIDPDLVDQLAETGARFTHHTSIAPTGTISLALANNASNGIEPSFAHFYYRNVIRPGRKTKERIEVFSYELLAYRTLIDGDASPEVHEGPHGLPDYFATTHEVTPRQHVDIQAAAQKWIDSSISKTANVPTDFPYEEFKDIYLYAYEKGLKGCTTFRFNPAVFQGVLVKGEDLANTVYHFTLEDGTQVEARGDEQVEYDGEQHTAANLFDALKEGYYGKW
ncbi:MAG: LAGLIDADG family homing endonuclease [Gammaproteobacteria bacterium]